MSKKALYTLEYPVRCSPGILYEFLSTPAGLQEWFADKVDERDGIFSFSWNGATDEKAELLEGGRARLGRWRGSGKRSSLTCAIRTAAWRTAVWPVRQDGQ